MLWTISSIASLAVSSCSSIATSRLPDPQVLSVGHVIRSDRALRDTEVRVAGYLCWDERFEGIFALVDTKSQCGGDYSYALNVDLVERPSLLSAKSGAIHAEVSGTYYWCDTCFSTGPIQNGTIKFAKITKVRD